MMNTEIEQFLNTNPENTLKTVIYSEVISYIGFKRASLSVSIVIIEICSYIFILASLSF